jgi:chromosome segregation ATPase
MNTNTVMTGASVEALKTDMDTAFERFSDLHAATEAAKAKFQTVAQGLGALNARRHTVGRAVQNLVQTFTQNLTTDPSAKIDTSKVSAAREEATILDAAMMHLRIGGHADAEREHLQAIVREAEAQLDFETRRLSHHEMQVAVLLGSAAELDGDLQLSGPGKITEQMREIVGNLNDKLGLARETLRAFDRQIADARAGHQASLREKTL